MDKIYNILVFCSGASKEILRKCPELEQTKYASLGVAVLLTSIFSFISSSFGFYLIVNSWLYSIFFGLFWGIVIFNLDRLIISSFRKTDNGIKNILTAIPRLILGLIIALISTKPIEIKLFEKQIELFIIQEDSRDYLEFIKPQQDEITKIEEKLAITKNNDSEPELDELEKKRYYLHSKISALPSKNDSLARSLVKELKSVQYEISTKRDLIQYERSRNIKLLEEEKVRQYENLKSSDSIFKAKKKTLLNGGFISRLIALNRVVSIDSNIKWIQLIFLFLFVLIELFPIIFLLLSPMGKYDYLVNREFDYNLSYIENIRLKLKLGNLQAAINDIFYLAESNENVLLYQRIARLTKQLKYLQEEENEKYLDANFVAKEYHRIINDINKLIIELESDGKLKLPESQHIKIKLSDLSEEEKHKALDIF
jgi:hypothetical protein